MTLVSCSLKKNQPSEGSQGVLQEYISESFHIKNVADRDRLLNLLTGLSKTRLAAWSTEQFMQAFVENKREFVKLVILEKKKLSSTEENITYELIYLDYGRSQRKQGIQVTNKKLCHVVNQQGKWLISEMHNIKELVEYRNEMTFPY